MGICEGATFGLELPLAEAMVRGVTVDLVPLGPPGGCGFLGQAVVVTVDVGSHERLPWD